MEFAFTEAVVDASLELSQIEILVFHRQIASLQCAAAIGSVVWPTGTSGSAGSNIG